MPNKLQAYAEQAERTARQITGSHLAWTAFLTTAARLYKYPYNEQLMIYMQRPEATACAEYDFWNEKMGRYVRRGSTGIALIDATGYKPRLKYVFDVSDTGGKENARRVNLWELKDAHTDSVSAMLERNYGVSGKNGLAEQFESVASQLAAEYWRDHSRDILGIVADSYLEEYDDYNIEVAFKNAAAVSITYSLMSRCGMRPEDHFEHEDFFSIFDFNTPRTVAALGTAVSEINEQVLRQIEVTIRNYEREHSAERTAEHGEQPDLHDERRLHDPRPEDRGAGAAPRQVRADAPEVPEGASAHPLEPDDLGGSPVPAPAGDRAGGAEPLRADDAGAGGGGRSDGSSESPRPNEMGGPDERLQGAGGGSDSRGADLRISEHPARGGQLSFFPTEAEQITAIEEAESVAQTPFAFSVSQAQLDHVLRLGGNEDDTRMVIASAFQKQKSVEDVAALLQSTFHGGNGFKTPEGELSAWYAVDGIHIAPGRSAEYVRSAQVIAWQDAAAHISQLMDSGAYASNVELAEAGQHERMQLAQALWYLKHDLSDEAREQGYLSCMDTLRGGGFPDETARLAEQLTNTDFRETLSGEFAQFYAAHEQDRSLLRFHYHKLDQIWQSLRELPLPRREYSSEMTAVPELARFITEDEIDHALDRGSGVEGGKGRIYEYFTADHTGKEKAAFLKDEYGIGGRSHAVSGASHSDESHNSRGIVLKKAGCANVELSWTKVAARIDSLIQKDRFLSPREKERYAQLQREKEAERELPTQAQTDYNAIKEAHPDDIVLFQVGDFFEMYGEDAKQAAELLDLNLTTRAIPGAGRVEMCGVPSHNLEMYLQHDMLKRNSLTHFDCWASAFGETTTAIELAPEGTGYRARTRFAKFFNLPELMNLFREAADIKTADQLNLPTPTAVYHTEVTQPTALQQQMVQELSERAAKVHSGAVAPTEDNMLKITSDGRKLGLDQRVINPDLPDDPNSKVNLCVNNIHRIWQDGQAEKLTQLVFCDLSTPKGKAAQSGRIAAKGTDSPELHALEAAIDAETEPEEPPFTIYDDIREKLVARGIPREQIAFIHEANTEARKKELFAKVRSGQVRVLMGSTFKMGAGMNVQDRLVALHDLDCPWRPGDLEQRSGRIIRQGNRNKEVHIYRYVTESTFDAYLWQTVENKQKFISQIMTSKSPVRSCEDIDEAALSYAEIKALCAGDERIREKMDLDVDVARLRLMKANHQSQQYRLEDNILRHFPAQIEENKGFLSGFEADMKTLEQHPHPKDGFAGMEVKGDFLTDKDNAGAAILEAFKDAKGLEPVPIGSYRGFSMSLTVENFGKDFILTLKGRMSHRVELGKDARGNLVRIDNALAQMPERYKTVQGRLENVQAQLATAKAELGKPFPQEAELKEKSARLAELNAELNIDDRTPMEQAAENVVAKRPSVLGKLKAPCVHGAGEKKKSHEQEAR